MSLPVLPPEIWRFILRYATEIPGFLDTSPLPPLCDDHRPWSTEQPYVKSDLATKSSLTLVCAQWYDIAIEFLFEYIGIDQLGTLLLLNQSLERSVERSFKAVRDPRPLGSHIKCLYFRLDFTARHPPFTYSFNQLLRLCTDLQCITFRGSVLPDPLPDISSLAERAPTLKACIVSGTASHSLSSHLPQFYKELQKFNSIVFLSLTLDDQIASVQNEPITLQNLHTLQIDFEDYIDIGPILDMIADWDLPSLRSLDLDANSEEPDPLKRFFRSHGAKITTLKLQTWDEMDIPIASITQLCPCIVDLGFNFYVLEEPLPSLSELQRIVHLGELYVTDEPSFNMAAEYIFAKTQPKLKCIRFQEVSLRDRDVSQWLGEFTYGWKDSSQKWFGGRNVRLESGDGVLIEIPRVDDDMHAEG